nr:retention module-containing protein [uncultured Halomonas sp.]
MSTPIATVLSVTGQAWARDADGNLRALEPGDVLLEGETLITSDNGRVRLDFGDAEPVAIGPGQTVAMLAELDADNPVPDDEATTTDESVDALLAAIEEGEGDLLEVLDPTAAGLGGGGGGGGNSFVRLARISESVDSLAFDFQPVQLDGLIEAQGESLIDQNEAPIGIDDTGVGQEDTALTGNVLSNDVDDDGDALTVVGFTINDSAYQAGETAELEGIGSLIVNGDGSYTFTPAENYNGPVPTVTYTVSDGELTDTATLDLTVEAVNDAPVAVDDTGSGVEDSIIEGNVLKNDSDIDGDALTVIDFTVNYPVGQPNPQGEFGEIGPIFPVEQIGNTHQAGESVSLYGIGTLTINSDGSYTFTPTDDWNGQVPVVTYTITDGEFFDTATLTLNIEGINDTPVGGDDNAADAADDALTTAEDTALIIDPQTLLANDDDVDGDTLTITGVGNASNGKVVLNGDGTITFTPNADYNGQATFDYTVSDGQETATASVTIDVTPDNDAPVALDDSNSVDAGDSVTATVGQNGKGVLNNDSDVDGDPIRVSQVEGKGIQGSEPITVIGKAGTLDIDSTGAYTYTSTLSTPVLYGFNDSDTQLTENLLENFALTSDAQQIVSITDEGVGVTSETLNHPTPDQINETGDVLVADLGTSVSSVTFGVARLFNDESGGESGKWYAYDAQGNLVGSGQFGPGDVEYRDGSNHEGTVTISADDVSGDFQFIAFEGIDYQNGSDNAENDGGDYLVTGITVQDAFDYTIVDDQGGDASATLTIDSKASLIGYQTPPDSAAEPEATITIDTIAGDDVINSDEYEQTVTITGSVGGDARQGDTVTLTVGENSFDGHVDADGNYSIGVPGGTLGEQTQVSASVSGENAAGNPYEASAARDYSVDTQTSATISIDTIAGDDEINGDESSQTIAITGTVGGDAHEGDIVTLIIGEEEIAGQVKADGTFSIDVLGSVLADNNQVTASVSGSDAAGNEFSADDTRDYAVNLPPEADSDKGATDEGEKLTVDAENGVLANDTDANGDTLTITEVDGEAGKVGTAIAGSNGGIFTLNADGSYSFDPNGEFELLAANQSKTTRLNYTVSDGDGGTDTGTLTVKITGTNDASVISGADYGLVAEDKNVIDDSQLIDSGTLNIADADANQSAVDTNIAPVASNGALGKLDINADGEWTYEVANTDVQYLAEGEEIVETFTVTTVDGTTHDIAITIMGTNDAPVIGGKVSGTVTEDGGAAQNATGQLSVTDVDTSDTHTWSVANGSGSYGSLTISSDGEWAYTLDNATAQSLGAGETRTETFTVGVADNHGGTDTQELVVTITGTNDVPMISGDDSGTVTEDASDPTLGDSGTLTIDDADANQSAIDTSVAVQASADALGSLVIDANGAWAYEVANADVQYLADGETKEETFTVTTVDGTEHDIVVTITGTNDVPTIDGDDTGAVTEDGSQPTIITSGQLSVDDVDTSDTHTWTVAGDATSDYGSFAVDANGQWTYTLNNASPTVQALTSTSDPIIETFTVQVDDGNGGIATQEVSVTINGDDDGAIITPNEPGGAAGIVKEDEVLSAGGKLDVTDPDAGQAVFNVQIGTAGSYGTFTIDADGNWSYALNNDQGDVQALAVNESLSETFAVETADGTTSSVTVTIQGTNDAPAISGDASGAVSEDATLSATGTLSLTDVDTSDDYTGSVNGDSDGRVTGTYGTITVDINGQWTYALDNTSDAVQSLAVGQKVTDTFTVRADDGHGGIDTQKIVVTITGTNDIPAISGEASGAVTEDGSQPTIITSGQLSVDDVDTSDTHTWTVAGDATSDYGSFAVDANGQWTYTLNNASPTVQALTSTSDPIIETFTVQVDDGNGGIATQEVSVTINGDDDGAIITPNEPGGAAGIVKEDEVLSAGGKLDVTDPDAGQAVFNVQIGTAGSYGTFTIDADGNWSYALNNDQGDVQALAVNESLSETFAVETADGTTSSVTVTIQGTNDAPAISGDASGAVSEDATLSATGTLSLTDVDTSDDYTGSVNGDSDGRVTGTYGTITVDINGQWTYALDNTSDAVQSLAADQEVTDTFTVRADDGHGGTDTQDIVITITGTNDIPEISGPVSISLSEEGLENGLADSSGTPDNTNLTVQTGQLTITDVDSSEFSLSLTAPATDLFSNGNLVSWANPTGNMLVGSAGEEEIIKVSIGDEGRYEVSLLGPVDHTYTASEDALSFDVSVTVSDGKSSSQSAITVTIEDDSPSVSQSEPVRATGDDIPETFTGYVSFAGDSGNSDKLTFAGGDVEVSGKGFTSDTDLTLTQAEIDQSGSGIGVVSEASPYHNIANEVGYRETAEGSAASEALTITLTGGKIAYGAEIDFEKMYGGEKEVGVAEFWRDGIKISTQSFTSDPNDNSGQYAANFKVEEGGFDTIIIKATDNGNDYPDGDNSDFTVSGITFTGSDSAQAFAFAKGTLDTEYGADGSGDLTLVGAELGLKTVGGEVVNVTPNESGTKLTGTDKNGDLVFEVNLTPATGAWDYYQYQELQGDNNPISFKYNVTDADGDSTVGHISIEPYDPEPFILDASSVPFESVAGLHGEYYGYNDYSTDFEKKGDFKGQERLHADDGSATQNSGPNLDTIDEVASIIEERVGSGIVGTGRHADANDTDASFMATNIDYDIDKASKDWDLGNNSKDKNGDVKKGNLHDFLAHGGDETSLEVTSGLGQTTDAIVRLAGFIYLEQGDYDIRVTSDDGFRLTIGGEEVASFDTITPPQTETYSVPLDGGFQSIELLYWDQGERSELKVELKESGDNDSEYKVLSTDNFDLFNEDPRASLDDNQSIVRNDNGSFSILTGDDYQGDSSANEVIGSRGNDTIDGNAGNDILYGQAGDDTLTGGAGSDTLYGGLGADTFAWALGDQGSEANPAQDSVMDFDTSEGDKLDLSDLLQDYESGDDELSSYIQATQDDDSTTLHISTTGKLGANGAGADQTIDLTGVDMGEMSPTDFVDDMVAKGQIDI